MLKNVQVNAVQLGDQDASEYSDQLVRRELTVSADFKEAQVSLERQDRVDLPDSWGDQVDRDRRDSLDPTQLQMGIISSDTVKVG